MKWYVVEITEACVLDGEYHRLCRQFQRAFIAAGAPPDMALFAQTLLFNDIRKVYFSPGSIRYVQALIEEYGGTACETPQPAGITLVFGVPDAGSRLLLVDEEALVGDAEEEIRSVLYPVPGSLKHNSKAVALAS